MRPIANLLWIFLGGGILLFIMYIIGGLFLCVTIIGIPFGIQKIKLSLLALAPFGQQVAPNDAASGCFAIIFNILWIICGGFWIAVVHLVLALIFTITIIGIPFAKQHVKLAYLAVAPFGKSVL